MNIREVLKKPLQDRLAGYGTKDIQKVIIDGIEFKGYKTYSFYWEKTYTEEPERSLSGVINNLNAIPFFVTPRLRINFSMMSIDDYRAFYNLILSRNEHVVTCYDLINNTTINVKMYVEPDDFPTIYMVARKVLNATTNSEERWQEILGIRDYTITLNGTNDYLDLYNIVYNSNPPADTGVGSITQGEESFALNTDVIIGRSSTIPQLTFNDKYKFKYWTTNADGSGTQYSDGSVVLMNTSIFPSQQSRTLVLYAQWEDMEIYTLNFSYGLSTPEIKNGSQRLNENVQYGQSITLPGIDANPQIMYDNEIYAGEMSPYYDGGWYTTPIKASGSVKLPSTYTYNKNSSSTIYCLYDTRTYWLTYLTGDEYISLSAIELKFGETIPKPTLYDDKNKFLGWFLKETKTEDGKTEEIYTPFTKTTMPPYAVTIYARWEEQK